MHNTYQIFDYKKLSAILPALWIALVVAACSGGGDGNGGGSTGSAASSTASGSTTSGSTTSAAPAAAGTASGTTLSVTTLGDQSTYRFISQGGFLVSEETTFSMPADVVSFVIHLTGTDVGSRLTFNSMTNPQGTPVDVTLSGCPPGETYCNVMLPYKPQLAATSGTWRYRLQSRSSNLTSFTVKSSVRSGTPPAATKWTVQPYMTGTQYNPTVVEAAMSRFVTVAAKNSINVSVNSVARISGSQYATVSADFTNSTTKAMVSNGASNVVNLFFVEDLRGTGGSTLGMAAGIPGSLGIAGSHNGVLINISAHEIGGQVNTSIMGDTAIHEAGHFLGLYHTTESDGLTHDPLADTPECTVTQDTNNDGSLTPNECRNFDGANLMFWLASTTIDQTVLTADQKAILRATPLAQ
ncbi:MAG: hypothetical protein H7833_06595 [Magnetococcus sp. DMHC-1]|nr:hypothetical protein [Magnetococcales bacterium]